MSEAPQDPEGVIAGLVAGAAALPAASAPAGEVVDLAARRTKGGGKGRKGRAGEGGAGSGRPIQPRPMGYDPEALNRDFALVLMGSKAVIVHEQPRAPIEDRTRILSLDAFRAWFLNRWTEFVDKDGKLKAVTWAVAWLQGRERRQFVGIEFHPDPANAPGTAGYFNLWRGFSVEPARGEGRGSYAIYKDHLLTNVCGGNRAHFDWLWAWMAHLVQRPRERIGTALVLRGKMGAGKTKVGEVLGSLVASHFWLVDEPRYVTGQFNAYMASCLLLQADEAVWAGDKAAEGRLKGLVTSEFQMIESKGIDPIRLKNYVRIVMTSNEDWVVPAGKDERRFAVFDVVPHVAQDHDYFRQMDAELDAGGRAALLADLLDLDLSRVNLRAIPRSDALLEQKLRSLDSVESWWLDRLMGGSPTRGGDGWPPDIPCAVLVDDYIATSDRTGIKRKAEETTFGMKLARLAPGLRRFRGWVDDPNDTSQRRRWCYALPPLAECRAAFDEAVEQAVAWPPDDETREGPGSEG